jgi:DNA polymerase-3 subunit beta
MHFTTTPAALLPALADACTGIASNAQSLPILKNLKIVLDAAGLVLTGTDLETEIVTRAQPDTAHSAGACTVDAKRLHNICKALPPCATLTAKLDGERLTLRAAGSRYALATLPVDSFPAFDRTGLGPAAHLPADLLHAAINTVQFASAVNDVRYYLNGLHLYTAAGSLYVVASDGHRLAKWQAPVADLELPPIIIPRAAVQMLARKLKGAKHATLAAGHNKIVIDVDEQSVAAKLIEGWFPDWQRVWPRKLAHTLRIEREPLIQALQRISLVGSEKYRACKFAIQGSELHGELHLSASVQGEGEGNEILVPLEIKSRDFTIGFNAAYLIDALTTATGQEVTLGFTETLNSCLIETPNEPDIGFVVMPMRI